MSFKENRKYARLLQGSFYEILNGKAFVFMVRLCKPLSDLHLDSMPKRKMNLRRPAVRMDVGSYFTNCT